MKGLVQGYLTNRGWSRESQVGVQIGSPQLILCPSILHLRQGVPFLHACSVIQWCLTLLQSHGLWSSRLPYLWNFPGKNTGMVSIFFSRGSSWPRNLIHVSCVSYIGRWILYHWATWEVLDGIYAIINQTHLITRDRKLSPTWLKAKITTA